MSTLYCFYDMEVSPASYDFFTFLHSAEICRLRRGFGSIKLILVKGSNFDFRHDEIRTRSQNETFFQNVILPGISLLPSCDSFMWLPREEGLPGARERTARPKGKRGPKIVFSSKNLPKPGPPGSTNNPLSGHY